MSDRPARPEWRAAYLDRTLSRRTARIAATARLEYSAPARDAAPRAVRIARAAPRARSLPLSITAMLHLVPSA